MVSALSHDLPESICPYQEIATRVGVSEKELLARLDQLRRSGVLRRFGAAVDHRKMGFAGNAMVVCRVPEERLEEAARAAASFPAVSHCYERETRPGWPYNLYAMVHAKTREECEEVAAAIIRRMGCEECRLLFSVRELKKMSPEYFSSGQRGGTEA